MDLMFCSFYHAYLPESMAVTNLRSHLRCRWKWQNNCNSIQLTNQWALSLTAPVIMCMEDLIIYSMHIYNVQF